MLRRAGDFDVVVVPESQPQFPVDDLVNYQIRC